MTEELNECKSFDDVYKVIGKYAEKVSQQHTDAEIQKMQEMEQAEIQKAYEIGKAESCSEKPNKWIPVSERLPEMKQHVLLSCYGRVIYGRMKSADGNSGYPVFEICDSVGEKRPIVLETTAHSEFTTSRINAWMPLPEPFKQEGGEGDDIAGKNAD